MICHVCTKRGGHLKGGLNNKVFILCALVTFITPPRCPTMATPPPVSHSNPFIYEGSVPTFFVTTILSKIWVRFSQHLVGRQIVVSLIQLSGLLVESEVTHQQTVAPPSSCPNFFGTMLLAICIYLHKNDKRYYFKHDISYL